MEIYVLYQCGYEERNALMAYEDRGQADMAKEECIIYEKNNAVIAWDMDFTDEETLAFNAQVQVLVKGHPMKISHSECGYWVGELELVKSV